MARVSNGLLVAAVVAIALLAGRAVPGTDAYDELPEGPAAEVARLYYTALSIPGLDTWRDAERSALLDVATLRYRDRLVDRASSVSGVAALRHIERLAESAIFGSGAVAQACAQYGVLAGPCAEHTGYVRRALVVEEMLVQGQLALGDLEVELIGAPRPGLSPSALAP